VDLKDYQLGLSRPFRSMKVYAALRTIGLEGIRAAVRRHILLAEYLDRKVRSHGTFECEMKPQFGLIVFRLKMSDDDTNHRLCSRLCEAGYFVRPVMSRERLFVRISLSHSGLTYDDVDSLFEKIVELSTPVLPTP
jgi:aromatic-L-amino-acid decarboxylase